MALYYETTGTGEPLVLLHAGIGDSRMWDAQVSALAPSYRVICFDAQGFGRSPMAVAPAPRAEDVRDLLHELGVARAHLVGLSMGGATAIDFALLYPSMVGALVLAASGLSGLDGSDDWLARQNRLEDELVERGDFAGALRVDLQTWLAGPARRLQDMDRRLSARLSDMLLDVLHHDRERKPTPQIAPPAAGRLAEIAAPCLVIVGDCDVQAVRTTADVLERGLRNVRKMVFHDTAHMVPLEHPTEFNAAVLDFLRQHPL